MGKADDDLPWAVAERTIPPPSPPPGGRGRRPGHWPRWWPAVPLALAALIVAVLVQHGSSSSSAHRPDAAGNPIPPAASMTIPPSTRWPTPSPTPSTRPSSTSRSLIDVGEGSADVGNSESKPSDRTSPTTISVGSPLLDTSGSWLLFGWGQGVMVRIQFDPVIIVRTPVPILDSESGAQLLIGPNRAMIRSQDNVRGYTVPDGGPATDLPSALARGGPMLPGPDPNHMWIMDEEHGTMDLVDWDGRPAGPQVTLPSMDAWQNWPESDGAGYPLFNTAYGEFDATPDGLHRITTGTLAAVGPSGYLVRECDDAYRCGLIAIDRASGKRRALHGTDLSPGYGITGVISPDGHTAALVQSVVADTQASAGAAGLTAAAAQGAGIVLIDLDTGESHYLSVPIDESSGTASMVFSPDSDWLFVTGADGLFAVHIADRSTVSLGHQLRDALPQLHLLAVRPAP